MQIAPPRNLLRAVYASCCRPGFEGFALSLTSAKNVPDGNNPLAKSPSFCYTVAVTREPQKPDTLSSGVGSHRANEAPLVRDRGALSLSPIINWQDIHAAGRGVWNSAAERDFDKAERAVGRRLNKRLVADGERTYRAYSLDELIEIASEAEMGRP